MPCLEVVDCCKFLTPADKACQPGRDGGFLGSCRRQQRQSMVYQPVTTSAKRVANGSAS